MKKFKSFNAQFAIYDLDVKVIGSHTSKVFIEMFDLSVVFLVRQILKRVKTVMSTLIVFIKN